MYSDKLLLFLEEKCPNLLELNVCGVKTFSNEGLLVLIQNKMNGTVVVSETPMKRLKKLDVKYTLYVFLIRNLKRGTHYKDRLSKEAIVLIQSGYPELTLTV